VLAGATDTEAETGDACDQGAWYGFQTGPSKGLLQLMRSSRSFKLTNIETDNKRLKLSQARYDLAIDNNQILVFPDMASS
jgi:hypothetical protein